MYVCVYVQVFAFCETLTSNSTNYIHHVLVFTDLRFLLLQTWIMNSALLNGILFCIVNVVFLCSGVFLNIVVVLCIGKSCQLRKKLCYFMIFILSCYDLVTVIVLHPLLIYWYVSWYLEGSVPDSQLRFYFVIGYLR